MNVGSVAVLAQGYPGGGHMWGDGSMWIWGTFMMVFWVAVIGFGIWLVVRLTRPETPRPQGRAEEILAERFARGELTVDEYRERLDALR